MILIRVGELELQETCHGEACILADGRSVLICSDKRQFSRFVTGYLINGQRFNHWAAEHAISQWVARTTTNRVESAKEIFPCLSAKSLHRKDALTEQLFLGI